jgi:hypothetical protein
MKVLAAFALLLFGVGIARGQGSDASGQPGSASPKAATPQDGTPGQSADKPKKKKVWTNDEIATVGGPGSISVVGNTKDAKSSRSAAPEMTGDQGTNSPRQRQIAQYRERLHQLNNQLEATDRQISDLRNFKATNTSASGGINMNHRYSMTPIEEQVKNLEEKKKQLQAQIGAVEDQARKEGVEPGLLR